MNFVRVRNILIGAAIVVVLMISFEDQLLSLIGASAGWRRVAEYVPIVAVFVLLAGVFALLAWRYRPQVQEQRREIARREGRTARFYVVSVSVVMALYFAGIAALGFFIRDDETARIAMLAWPAVLGIGYSIWYGNYARKAVARHDASGPDVFS